MLPRLLYPSNMIGCGGNHCPIRNLLNPQIGTVVAQEGHIRGTEGQQGGAGWPWPIALVGDNRNLKLEAYFEVLYPFCVLDFYSAF